MNTREACEMLVKSLKVLKEDFEKEQLKKGLLGATKPATPKSAVMGKDKSKMAGVGPAPKTVAAAFGGKNDLNKPAVAKSDELEKSGKPEGKGPELTSKRPLQKNKMMKMVGYMKGCK